MTKQEETPVKQSEKTYRYVSDEEFMKYVEEVFGDVDKFWRGLHPSVQRLVLKAMKEDLFDWKGHVKDAEDMLNKAGLTKEDVEFKPKTYNVGEYEIKFKS